MAQTPKPLYQADVDGIVERLKAEIAIELRPIIRAELIAELQGGGIVATKKKPGPKPKGATVSAKVAPLKVKKGVRRSAEDVADAARVLGIWLNSNPGSRIDQAAAALQVPVKDLQLPVKFLLKSKKLAKKGKLRGTTYTMR
jgi:hypothetical protein